MTTQAGAVTFELLHSFERPGTTTQAALVQHADGHFYGTAASGGAANQGAIYRLSSAGVLSTVYALKSTDGAAPTGSLCVGADGELYGAAPSGGANGFGSLFKVSTAGVFTKLADFTGTAGAVKGSVPEALVLAADGNFYGTTQAGGSGGFGTVFRMTPAGVVTTLVEFTGTTGAAPGYQPLGPLAANGSLLYGVTKAGGSAGLGVIYEITTAGVFRVLGQFTGTAGALPGASAAGGLYFNSTDGLLYGTTEYGGTNSFGVAFKISTAVTPVFTVLRHFADPTGSQPVGTLVKGSDGDLYGMTYLGGTASLGTIYKMTTSGTHTVLANFTGSSAGTLGSSPRGGLCAAANGRLYAVTPSGGAGNLGQAFEITTAGVFTALSAVSLNEGWNPNGAPVLAGTSVLFPNAAGGSGGGGNLMSVDTSGTTSVAAALGGTLGNAADGALFSTGGNWYGVTAKGGASGRGTMFRYSAAGGAALVLAYTTSAGSLAEGPLILGADGLLWGVGREGGASSRGTIYKITTAGVKTRVVSLTGTVGAAPGEKPRGPLALASDGNYYGLCGLGGTANTGLLFKLTPAGVYTSVSQCAATGPRSPAGGLVIGSDGALYGTMSAGGTADAGVFIKYIPNDTTWTVLGEFSGSSGATAGSAPGGELHVASDGTIYGMTTSGGGSGAGSVFRYTAGNGLETLFSFTGSAGAYPGTAGDSDGAGLPYTGGLATGSDGKLYGVAPGGGTLGGGVVFRLSFPTAIQTWKQTYLGDANAADTADPDGDGRSTLLEYAQLTHPALADIPTSAQPTTASYVDGISLTLSVPRDPARNDINLFVEAADTLLGTTWSVVASSTLGAPFSGLGYVSGDSSSAGVKTVIIRDTALMASSPRRFMRLRIVRP